jgi:predicted GNAT family N-acyltransferase
VDEVEKAAAELSPATQKWFATQVKPSFETYGSFYKADLPDEMLDRMLDYDASIKSQPENIRNALQPLLDKHGIARTADIGTLISAMGRDMPQSMVSEKLRELGIPGIKYLDAGSRGQGGSGTRNFVVFPGEEKKVSILERDGKKLASALKATAAQKQDVEVNLYPVRNQPNVMYLSKIEVPQGQRGQGIGSSVMQDIISQADADGKTITLTPSTAYGATSTKRLKDFYKRFGFVENSGRNKNYALNETMYRLPRKPKE